MNERRAQNRERVMFGATAAANQHSARRECVVRSFSEQGATVQFSHAANLPNDIALTIARKGRSYQAKIVWSRDNVVGVAFSTDAPAIASGSSELEERLRISEKKTRQLKRRVRDLLGEG